MSRLEPQVCFYVYFYSTNVYYEWTMPMNRDDKGRKEGEELESRDTSVFFFFSSTNLKCHLQLEFKAYDDDAYNTLTTHQHHSTPNDDTFTYLIIKRECALDISISCWAQRVCSHPQACS
jgi:hypothetical protein